MDPIALIAALAAGLGGSLVTLALARRRDRRDPAARDAAALEAFLLAHPGWRFEATNDRSGGWYVEVRCPRDQMPTAAADWHVVANARRARCGWAIASLVEQLRRAEDAPAAWRS